MKQRTISAIILLGILISALVISSKLFGIVMMVVAILGFNEFFDIKYLQNCSIIIDYIIKIWIFILKCEYDKLNENDRIKLLTQKSCQILNEEVKNDLSGINDKNMERIINNMSLLIAIMGKYKDLAKEVKTVIPLAINICKEKTELLRKNAAILMARYAKAAPENEEYLRALHGMEVLVSVSPHLKI